MRKTRTTAKYKKAYDRAILRTAFVSLFWAIVTERRKHDPSFTLQGLAKRMGANKAELSRWFKSEPNWTLNTIANLANGLGVDLQIQAIDQRTGVVFTPAGIQTRIQKSFPHSQAWLQKPTLSTNPFPTSSLHLQTPSSGPEAMVA
jgi:transcriptional regulator with XRE-family HTH domain